MQGGSDRFNDATDAFYAGSMSVKEYKGISGGFGSYAQRGGSCGMVRLRLAGGRIARDKMRFICDCIEKYHPGMVHLTTCQSLQLHGLDPDAVKDIVATAPSAGIHTFGGGGDYPRNVTATPLSGIIASSRLDVMPYAQAVEDFLLRKASAYRLPRKLKVGLTCTMENIADATMRDLGFIVREDGMLDVYSGGGLGKNPKLGLKVAEAIPPEDILVYADAMFRMFMEHGNYNDRSKARVRYMRDTLGDSGYIRTFREFADASRVDPEVPRVRPEPEKISKKGDGSVPASPRAKPQATDGLFYVTYHPIGGDPEPERLVRLLEAVMDMDDAEVRISPNQTMYVVNLTGGEADRIAEITSDGAGTVFEASVSCVGASVCQIGLRDSNGLLKSLIDMERKEGFADRVLPMIRISGCVNSCAAHQVGTVALCGSASVDGCGTFTLFVNGSHILGKERLGDEVGKVKTDDLPEMFRAIGKAVEASGAESFLEWHRLNPDGLRAVCAEYLCRSPELAGRS